MKQFAVALPHGEGFGWGVAGTYIANGLRDKIAATVYASDTDRQSVEHDVCLQAIAGPSWGYTSNFRGKRMIGYGFIEDTAAANRRQVDRSRLWDCVVSGSTWMANHINGGEVVVQGIDPTRYRVYDDVQPDPDYFTIGSFGKFEFRKGQDVLIKALADWLPGKKNVRLIHAWGNLWPNLVMQFDKSPKLVEFPKVELLSYTRSPDQIRGKEWEKFTHAVLASNGVLNLPHWPASGDLSRVYGMCDVAVFPNRCEAGTNLCLHEAMACGVPSIVQSGTGHDDIIGALPHGFVLRNNQYYGQEEYYMWSKPCTGELVDKLELAYQRWSEGKLQKLRSEFAQIGAKYTWDRTVDSMAKIMLSYS